MKKIDCKGQNIQPYPSEKTLIMLLSHGPRVTELYFFQLIVLKSTLTASNKSFDSNGMEAYFVTKGTKISICNDVHRIYVGYRQSYASSEAESTDFSLSSSENLCPSLRQEPQGEETSSVLSSPSDPHACNAFMQALEVKSAHTSTVYMTGASELFLMV